MGVPAGCAVGRRANRRNAHRQPGGRRVGRFEDEARRGELVVDERWRCGGAVVNEGEQDGGQLGTRSNIELRSQLRACGCATVRVGERSGRKRPFGGRACRQAA